VLDAPADQALGRALVQLGCHGRQNGIVHQLWALPLEHGRAVRGAQRRVGRHVDSLLLAVRQEGILAPVRMDFHLQHGGLDLRVRQDVINLLRREVADPDGVNQAL